MVLALAMAPILSDRSCRRLEYWQRIVNTPTATSLSPDAIVKAMDKIPPWRRNEFFKLRRDRIGTGALYAVHSTRRASAADRFFDEVLQDFQETLEPTAELVVYSQIDRPPVHCWSFPDSAPDTRLLATMCSALAKAGFSDVAVITDLGCDSLGVLADVLLEGTCFVLTSVPIGRQPACRHLEKQGGFGDRPGRMNLDMETDVFFRQFEDDSIWGGSALKGAPGHAGARCASTSIST